MNEKPTIIVGDPGATLKGQKKATSAGTSMAQKKMNMLPRDMIGKDFEAGIANLKTIAEK